ncbi:trimeric intracellular cation channel family protein [Actinomadura sp. GC306]|uniref:trimeric intracellular cation channel family protein n=1 Tax=Actinomadura sp. GC306 TaxID=2530367 RepID=UPI001047B351|nr:TRIC cation channel family protein [Actinomadura sp. GC306]TDC70817.1 trimeric intracellular cation channel family protein [Actinomadura sp. GC306]
MSTVPPLLLALDLAGTFAFGLNGALTAVRATRLDVVGVVGLGMITALGGGVIRDVILGAVPPATFVDWRYFALAALGGLLAFGFSRFLYRLELSITIMDAIGLSTFAVIGASKALAYGMGVGPALLLGVVTGVGGGTMRDVLIGRIPSVLRSDLYAIPAFVAAAITVAAVHLDLYDLPAALLAVAACFTIRMLGVHLEWHAPRPPRPPMADDADA